MELALSPASTLSTMSKTLTLSLHRHLLSSVKTRPCPRSRLVRSTALNSVFNSPNSLRTLCAIHSVRSRLNGTSTSAASFSSAPGGGGGDGAGIGGRGGGGGGGGEDKANAVAGGAEEGSADVIILDVGGMTCGGCAASVKRILENQPHVSSAYVNLATETAIVWPLAEAKLMPYWQKQLGEALAKQLTSCGFKSNIRGSNLDSLTKFKKEMQKTFEMSDLGTMS